MSGSGQTLGPATAPAPSIVADANYSLKHPGPATNATTNVFFSLVLTGQDAVVSIACPESCHCWVGLVQFCILSWASSDTMLQAPLEAVLMLLAALDGRHILVPYKLLLLPAHSITGHACTASDQCLWRCRRPTVTW